MLLSNGSTNFKFKAWRFLVFLSNIMRYGSNYLFLSGHNVNFLKVDWIAIQFAHSSTNSYGEHALIESVKSEVGIQV